MAVIISGKIKLDPAKRDAFMGAATLGDIDQTITMYEVTGETPLS